MKRILDILIYCAVMALIWAIIVRAYDSTLTDPNAPAWRLLHSNLMLVVTHTFFVMWYMLYWLGPSVSRQNLTRGYLMFPWSTEQKAAWETNSK